MFGANGLDTKSSRAGLSASHFMIWASSAIVVGITGYFLSKYNHDGHLIYQMVISALTLALWLPSMFLPFMRNYRQYYMPLNLIFSYLWLTAFIFATQDYNRSSCLANAPTFGSCTLKKTNEAFMFIPFFFHLVAFLLDMLAWRHPTTTATHLEKDNRQSVETGHTATA